MQVSIILPTYNRSAMLPRAVDSVLAQTFKDWELLILDDGSTDETREVAEDYVKKDKRIRYLHHANSGLPTTRARGVELTKSSYLAFLDDDDTFAPDKLEKQTAFLESHPEVELVYSHVEVKGEAWGGPRLWPDEAFVDFLGLVKRCTIQPNAALVRRSAFEKLGNFRTDLASCDDYEMWLRIALKGKIAFLPGVCGAYYWHGGNMSRDTRRRSHSRNRIYRLFLKSGLNPELRNAMRTQLGVTNYMQASDALETSRYESALYHFIRAIKFCPEVGIRVHWNQTAPFPYRLIRPYLGTAFAALKRYTTKNPR